MMILVHKKKKIHYLIKLEYFIRPIKNNFSELLAFWKVCLFTQYLVGAHFALITASIRRSMEVISLWHC